MGHMKRPLLMMVWYAILMHYAWAVLLFVPNGNADRATAPYALVEVFGGKHQTAMALILVATLALGALLAPLSEKMAVPFLIPQQLLLGISAAGAVQAMWMAQFADGVARDRAFIVADQSPAVLAFVLHTLTIAMLLYDRLRKETA